MIKTIMRLLTAITLAACASAPTKAPDAPKPEILNWEPIGEEKTLDVSNIWEAINGAAELHIAYGFRQLSLQDYKHNNIKVTVEIFDQASPINAFGIFKRERSPEAVLVNAGAAATMTPPYDCAMIKGKDYVRAQAYEGEMSRELCESILMKISAQLKGDSSLPKELNKLPIENRLEGSMGFTRQSYLGVSELTNCLHATYKMDKDKTTEIFVIIKDTNQNQETEWKKLQEKWNPTTVNTLPALTREIPYKGVVLVVKTENEIIGISGTKSLKEAQAVLEMKID